MNDAIRAHERFAAEAERVEGGQFLTVLQHVASELGPAAAAGLAITTDVGLLSASSSALLPANRTQ